MNTYPLRTFVHRILLLRLSIAAALIGLVIAVITYFTQETRLKHQVAEYAKKGGEVVVSEVREVMRSRSLDAVDALQDFRRPRQHSILGLSNGKGMGDYMRGEIPLHAILQTTSDPNLIVVVAGPSLQVPYEWLTPVKVGSLLKTLGKGCNYVLIDTPALLSVADPMVLASQVDSVILVVAGRRTKRQHLQIALQQFKEIKADVLGIVLNREPYSNLYNYYSDEKQKRTSTREEIGIDPIVVDSINMQSG